MKKYDVTVQVTFQGVFNVQANSKAEAHEIVSRHAFVMRGEIGAGTKNIFEGYDDEIGIYDWEWPCHADLKNIKSIKKQ
jgi:hypothetical protein